MNQSEWEEIFAKQLESRHELTLTGDKIAEKVLKNGGMIDESLFEIGKQLNYLKLAKLGLSCISPKISHLSQLVQLSIIENKITEIPMEIALLTNLVYLDLSCNNILSVPGIFSNLSKLRTLNLRNNQITEINSFNGLSGLQELFLDHNKIACFPNDTLILNQLMILDLSNNEIADIPKELCQLKALKNLNLENNLIDDVLPELGHMVKLKQIQLKNNPLKNVKTQLKKLINDDLFKAITDYLKKLEINHSKKPQKRNSSSKKSESSSVQESDKLITITNEDPLHIIILKNRLNISRSQVVYFIVKKLMFTAEKLKRFIKYQEQLHKNECENRKATTIGTHDLTAINFPLIYSPKPSQDFTIQMMNSSNPETGKELFERLLKEAELERKSRKRGNISGVYQYLYMIDINEPQGVIEDSKGSIVSYPPLTNCNLTKMNVETTDLLIEVIGTKLDKCKSISELIVRWLIENEVSSSESCLEIEPMRVYEDNSDLVPESGQNLLVLFPSRTDLNGLNVHVVRE